MFNVEHKNDQHNVKSNKIQLFSKNKRKKMRRKKQNKQIHPV